MSKLPIFLCAGLAVLALLLSVDGGIFLFTRDGGEPTTQGDEPAEEQTDEPSDLPADVGGNQDDPYALGQPFTFEDGRGGTLDVTIGENDWDATDAVTDTSSSNFEVSENQSDLLVPVSLTHHGEDSAEPLLLSLEYRSEAGGIYTDDGALTPESRTCASTLYDGQSWDYGMFVPVDEVETGHLTVRVLFDFAVEETGSP